MAEVLVLPALVSVKQQQQQAQEEHLRLSVHGYGNSRLYTEGRRNQQERSRPRSSCTPHLMQHETSSASSSRPKVATRREHHEGDGEDSMLARHCEQGQLKEAVEALDLLVQQRACQISELLLYRVIKMCMAEQNLALGMRVHALASTGGYENNAFLATHLVAMYACHGKLEQAVQVFAKVTAPDAHLWATMISTHARHGQPKQALQLYDQMRKCGMKPDSHVFVAVLTACAAAQDLVLGKEVHADILASAKGTMNRFVGSSLVNMYAKCGSLEDAIHVFDSLEARDVVTWNALLAGYTQQGLGRQALVLYARMRQEHAMPGTANTVTFVCLLRACGSVGALQQGKQLHVHIRQRGLEADATIGSCLVDMYAKCGSLEDARTVFDRLPSRDVVTWNALLNAYAEHGKGDLAVKCFQHMREQDGIVPDLTTFSSLLVACRQAGLVHEGKRYFAMMVAEHALSPTDYHYNCMVHLLGQAGSLDEAEAMLHTMPFQDQVIGWTSLLTACQTHDDAKRARRCYDRLVELEPDNATPYVLLANIYATAGRWEDVDLIETQRKNAGAWKKAAKACIEVKNEVHEFSVGQQSPDTFVSSKLRSVNTRLKEEGGHVPRTELVLKAVSEQQKEDALCGHAEKLALAFGLLNTPDGTPLIVTKNLRMCNDCHSGTKIMSHLEQRSIIVRDIHRVHRFVDGTCSCGDRH